MRESPEGFLEKPGSDRFAAAFWAAAFLNELLSLKTFSLVYKKMNWNVPEEHFFAPGGSFSIELPRNTYSLRIERGKEYLPIQDNISLPDSGKVEKAYRLQRWANMANQGWYSADMHAHASLREVAALMDGDGNHSRWNFPSSGWRSEPTSREDLSIRKKRRRWGHRRARRDRPCGIGEQSFLAFQLLY
ncbi:MAG: hypothetical protein WCA20_01190, partial [Candidatus Sulfotelmatobacter sp.]